MLPQPRQTTDCYLSLEVIPSLIRLILAGWIQLKDLSHFSPPALIHQHALQLSTIWCCGSGDSHSHTLLSPSIFHSSKRSSLLKNNLLKHCTQLALSPSYASSVWEGGLVMFQILKWHSFLKKIPQHWSRETGIHSLWSIRASVQAWILRDKQRHLDCDGFQSPDFHLRLWALQPPLSDCLKYFITEQVNRRKL